MIVGSYGSTRRGWRTTGNIFVSSLLFEKTDRRMSHWRVPALWQKAWQLRRPERSQRPKEEVNPVAGLGVDTISWGSDQSRLINE